MEINHELICGELCGFLSENILAEGVVIDTETGLSELGVDSFSIVEIVLFIERKFGIILPEDNLNPATLKNVSSLAACVGSHLGDHASKQ